MSATMERTTDRRAPSSTGARIQLALVDGIIVARRNLVTLTRVPTVFIFELVQPIMFVLLFRYIYANQFSQLPPGVKYVQFLMPGIFVQNALFGSTSTATTRVGDSASRIWIAMCPRPPAPITTAVEPGSSSGNDRLIAW